MWVKTIRASVALALALAFACARPASDSGAESGAESARYGVTFSALQCWYLGLDWEEAYEALLTLDPRYLRLAAYWSVIEKEKGVYDFSELDLQIERAGARGIPVVLAFGLKVPRWPEFSIPAWADRDTLPDQGGTFDTDHALKDEAFAFIEAVVRRYRESAAVRIWQVENEPFSGFGEEGWKMTPELVAEEIERVRALDGKARAVLLTEATYPHPAHRFFNDLIRRKDPIYTTMAFGDIVGINIYPNVGQQWGPFRLLFRTGYKQLDAFFGPLLRHAKDRDTALWITELQAEPWESGVLVYKDEAPPASVTPEMIGPAARHFEALGFDVIFLWGAEFWYYRLTQWQDDSWWNAAREVFASSETPKRF